MTLVESLMALNASERPAGMREVRAALQAIELDSTWSHDDARRWWVERLPETEGASLEETAATEVLHTEDMAVLETVASVPPTPKNK